MSVLALQSLNSSSDIEDMLMTQNCSGISFQCCSHESTGGCGGNDELKEL